MINVIVFSKDRACQLDLFLRSYHLMIGNPQPTCLIRSTTERYQQGYDLLRSRFPSARYIPGVDLKTDILSTVDPSKPLTVFFCDDCIINRPFRFDSLECDYFLSHAKILCYSLRLFPNVRRAYTDGGRPLASPRLDDHLCYEWRGCDNDWGYPMSVDSHVFRTADILPQLRAIPYSSPTSLESQLTHNPLPMSLMMVVAEQIAYNIPQNTTQTEWDGNREVPRGLPLVELNTAYLDGWEINLDPLINYEGDQCFRDVVYALRLKT